MIEAPGIIASPFALLLDVADKLLKLVAVVLGGIWTYWNYRKSRIYAQKMELQIAGAVFQRNGQPYCEIALRMKNLGGSRQRLQPDSSFCEVTAIFGDLDREVLDVQPVFTRELSIEAGETVGDLILLRLPSNSSKLVWLQLRLRVASQGIEWQESDLVRMTLDETSTHREGEQTR